MKFDFYRGQRDNWTTFFMIEKLCDVLDDDLFATKWMMYEESNCATEAKKRAKELGKEYRASKITVHYEKI